MTITDLAVGTAGEYLVCADLILAGANAFLADQNCAYDVVLDLGDSCPLRIQVKTTLGARSVQGRHPVYVWSVRRREGAVRAYGKDEFDILALVAVDINRIAYLRPDEVRQTIHILQPGHVGRHGQGKHFDHYSLDRALEER